MLKVCRGCLSQDGTVRPLAQALKKIFIVVTGIQIKDGDGYPLHFCAKCRTQIKKIFDCRRRFIRANFILKEIMIVTGQITLSAINTVDRKKMNLISDLDYWNGEKNALSVYTADIYEEDIENNTESNQVNDITFDNKVCHIIDIKPASQPQPEPELVPEIESVSEIDIYTGADVDDDCGSLDIENIDFNNIFKGLKEEEDSELESPSEDIYNPTTKAKKSKIDKKYKKALRHSFTAKCLCNADIIVLDPEDLWKSFEERKQCEPYNSARYKCDICVTTFESIESLTLHMADHNKTTSFSYTCAYCKYKFSTQNKLAVHLAGNHLYEYICKMCGVKMYTLSELKSHNSYLHLPQIRGTQKMVEQKFTVVPLTELDITISKVTGSEKLACQYCKRSYNNIIKLSEHFENHYQAFPKDDMEVCRVCGLMFSETKELECHKKDWHEFKYVCKICENECYNKAQARMHIMKHEFGQKCTACEVCGKTYKSQYFMAFHKLKVHSIKVTFPCILCGDVFVTQEDLYQHQLVEHKFIAINNKRSGNPEFYCELCNVQFVTLQSYENHVLKIAHEGAKNIERTCFFCNMSFDTTEEYRTHICETPSTSKSTAKKWPKKCKYCEVQSANADIYRKHHHQMHPDEPYVSVCETYLCEYCAKEVNVSYREVHRRNHFRIPEFPCDYCKLHFESANAAAIHVLAQHTKKPYRCALCTFGHHQRYDVRDHILKVHSPVKPYMCSICDRKFAHLDILNSHSIKVHDTNVKKNWPRKPCQPYKRIQLYPFMKIDASYINPKILDVLDLETVDFLEEKTAVAANKYEYFIFEDVDKQEVYVRPKKKKKKDKKRRKSKRKRDTDEFKAGSNNTNNSLCLNIVKNDRPKYVDEDPPEKRKKPFTNIESSEIKTSELTETNTLAEKSVKSIELINNDTEMVPEKSLEVIEEIVPDAILDNSMEIEVLLEEKENDKASVDTVSSPIELSVDSEELRIEVLDGEEFVLVNGILYKLERET